MRGGNRSLISENIQRCHREHLAIVSIRQSAAARSEVSSRSGN
jgi:hypothetical protein